MAAGTKIIFSFGNAEGGTIKHSYNYGNAEATVLSVKNYMNSCITNGTMFNKVPVSIKGAVAQITTETEFDLSD